ncbi:hypothetical protein PIB30_097998, partial [Stylosanthes scabra]|nr:hypothetical protein [Stylosanthes scabra]
GALAPAKLPTQLQSCASNSASNTELPRQHPEDAHAASDASRVACAANNGAHAPEDRKSPNLKARSGISSLWTKAKAL